MKDLICIFTYCPDNKRKKVLHVLLEKLKVIKTNFDILVVSHSKISDMSYDILDYFYYDKNNELLNDFDLNNDFWFENENFKIKTSTIYSHTTHLAIYSLLYYVFNFAKHKQYNKVHCVEYDINLYNSNLFLKINEKLNECDTIMFKGKNGWVSGVYFAFTLNNFPEEYFTYNKEDIIRKLRDSNSKMTENITPSILDVNGRTMHFESLETLNPNGIYQTVDSHKNNELNWCVPVYDNFSEKIYFFVYNENGGEFKIDVVNGKKHFQIFNDKIKLWSITEIGNINETKKIIIMVNDKVKKEIIINEKNKQTFIENNFIQFQ